MIYTLAKGITLKEGEKLNEYNYSDLQWNPIEVPEEDHWAVLRKRRKARQAKRERIEAVLRKAILAAVGVLGACLCLYGATL